MHVSARAIALIAAILPSLAWAIAPNSAKSPPPAMHRIANECAGALLALVSSQGCLASIRLLTPQRIAAKETCRQQPGKDPCLRLRG